VTKYVSSEDNATFEEAVQSAELFKKQKVAVILTHNPNYIINIINTNTNKKYQSLEDGIRCPETLVKDYHSRLRNTPEECRSHQHHGGSLKS
jgi:hypothetical protein